MNKELLLGIPDGCYEARNILMKEKIGAQGSPTDNSIPSNNLLCCQHGESRWCSGYQA